MSTLQIINGLLEKLDDWDQDGRYMATSDLCRELEKDIKMDAALEARICAAVLKRLDDQSNDVQSKAIQCLAILLKKVQDTQVFEICDKLCTLILEGKDELRDIYAIGLKTLVADVPEKCGQGVAQRLIRRFLNGVSQEKNMAVKLECLDCLSDLLKRFGHEVEENHQSVVDVLMQQLVHAKPVVRKKATACIGAAAVVLSDPLLNTLTENLLQQIAAGSGGDVRTMIQTIGTISRTVGYRLGRHLDRVVPLFLQNLGDPEDEAQQTEAHNELRDTCLQGFESFVLRCSREIQPHLPAITTAALTFMKYDPNYNYGDDDEDQMEEDEDWDDGDDYEDEGLDDEDDDTSWKVRRAAIKVLSAIILARPEKLEELYDTAATELVGRFKEREENVRLDIVDCFTGLVRMTLVTETRLKTLATSGSSSEETKEEAGSGAVAKLEAMLPAITAAALKQLSGKADKTKSAVFSLFKIICSVVSGGLGPHMAEVTPSVQACLGDKNQTLKLDVLTFLRMSMEAAPPLDFQQFLADLLPLVLQAVSEEWYKIIAEALRVVKQMIIILRPLDSDSGMFLGDFDTSPFVDPIYQSILGRLQAHDIDQEIKECAITAMGQLVATLGDSIGAELPNIEGLLMERLRNEITRMPTLKALVMIAQSPLNIDLSPILTEATTELTQFLRQQSRPLKQTTLETLMALVKSSATAMDGSLYELILSEAAPLISDSDLHLTHLALRLTIDVLSVSPSATNTTAQYVLPKVLLLATSPLLQGRALESLVDLLKEFVSLDAPGTTFDDLYGQLQGQVTDAMQKQAVGNIGHCLATLCVHATPERREATLGTLVAALHGADEPMKHLALLTIGGLGQHRDLTSVAGLQDMVLQSFESSSEETKTAAAYCLGRMAVGNMAVFLPVIFQRLAESRNEYLLLSSLKEVIVLHANSPDLDFGPYIEQVLPTLFQHCESPEEGVRNMVAECLGSLVTVHPDSIVSQLIKLGEDVSNNLMRWTIVTSLRYCMTGRAPHLVLLQHMDQFLTYLQDEDLSVRHATLQMCNAAVHHQPGLIVSFLPTIIPVLYETVELKQERVVDLGPFKQKVDDGLPLRKIALACINTILDTLPDQIEVEGFMPFLQKALADLQDVQMLGHQILIKICTIKPLAVSGGALDALVEPLEKTATKKIKEGQVGTEVERANDLIRSGLRAMLAIEALDLVTPKFSEFYDRMGKREKLAPMIEAIKAEN